MRILFFSHYFPPEVNAPATRTFEHCRAWARAGEDVTVVTCAPNHPRGQVYPGFRNRLWQTETCEGVKVVRLWTFIAANEGFTLRTLTYFSYFVASVLALPFLPRADVVISTSPQFFCGLVGMVAKLVKRTPWVLEIRDLWPESIVTVGAMKPSLAIRFLEWLESLSYRRADVIVSVTDSFVAHIKARGGRKIAVIKNGVDLDLFARNCRGDEVKRRYGFGDRFVASYVGTVGMAHRLDTVLEAARLLHDDARFAILIVGEGAEKKNLEARAAELGLDNVRFTGQLPKSEMPAVWDATDASVILLRKSDTFTRVIPSKMFEAMAMERPIILGVEGEAKRLLEAAEAGIAITPESSAELAAAIRRLADDHELAARTSRRGGEFVRANFDRTELAGCFLDLLATTIMEARSGASGAFSRRFAFARHMPLRKLVRRLELDARRRLDDRWPARPVRALAPQRSGRPPQPLFAPRRGLAPTRAGAGWTFTFLHRTVAMKGPRIDWSAPDLSPANQLWRMNLHYMEYLEGLETADWTPVVDDWIGANDPRRPGAWRDSWNSYALSLRAVVWMQELARRGDAIDARSRAAAEASLAGQLAFLDRNLETDLGGNHLIKNIKALAWASAYFTGADSARWRTKAINLLRRELAEQVPGDGMHYERSPSYHCQVFADLLECRHAFGRDPLGGALDGALARMAQATADLAHPDGFVALFNDAGLHMAYSPVECLDAYERLFEGRPAGRTLFAFRDAGYFGLRSESFYFLVDCGRIAPDDLPAHGHGDVLSFELSVGGLRFIVDQGVYEYIAGQRRAASRTAANHNTLCLEGADQADFFGAFRCGRRPDIDLRAWAPSQTGFELEGAHNGFMRHGHGPRHVRRIEASKSKIEIVDRVEEAPQCGVRIGFLLHPEVVVTNNGDDLVLRRSSVGLRFSSREQARIESAVWWPDMGREAPTQRIVLTMPPGRAEARTVLAIQGDGGVG